MDTFTRDGLVFDVTDAAPAGGSSGSSGSSGGSSGGSDDSRAIVLLHGFPESRRQWEALTPLLTSAGYRVLAPDQRGYSPGARPVGRRSYVQSELVADAVALLDAAGLERAHVVGHDWGALVAWALASRHPERVHTLTTVSVPHPKAFAWAMPRGQVFKSWYMAVFQIPGLPERLLPTKQGVGLISGPGLPPEKVRSYFADLGPDGLTGALNWYRALPWSQRERGYARPTTVPTTHVWGDRDPALGRAGAEATERFVDAPYRFAELTGLGHWIPEEAPDRLAEIVLDRVGA